MHGILPKVMILNKSLIALGEQKLKEGTAPAAWVDILNFAKTVRIHLYTILSLIRIMHFI
jgi:hypothetical protein